ncbi:response regulator transcription factor [Neisseriaceae bacterium TC5R-5]|nr:response regulator transcription factor [Neisseriaceae bacterium TC5R-5]
MGALVLKSKIIILDDHDVVRVGLEAALSCYDDLEIIGSYGQSKQLLSALREILPDVLLLDFSLNSADVDGLNLIQSIKVKYPNCKILVISSINMAGTINLILKAGASGFFSKTEEIESLADAIRQLRSGNIYLSAQLMHELDRLPSDKVDEYSGAALDLYADLSPKEQEVVRCCLDGMTVTQIAEKFSRSIKTISTQKQMAYKKLGVSSDRELFLLKSKLD